MGIRVRASSAISTWIFGDVKGLQCQGQQLLRRGILRRADHPEDPPPQRAVAVVHLHRLCNRNIASVSFAASPLLELVHVPSSRSLSSLSLPDLGSRLCACDCAGDSSLSRPRVSPLLNSSEMLRAETLHTQPCCYSTTSSSFACISPRAIALNSLACPSFPFFFLIAFLFLSSSPPSLSLSTAPLTCSALACSCVSVYPQKTKPNIYSTHKYTRTSHSKLYGLVWRAAMQALCIHKSSFY